MPACVTLEPNAIHEMPHDSLNYQPSADLPEETQQVVRSLAAIGSSLNVMLDSQHIPMNPTPGWATGCQDFASFLAANPTGPELKRRRTHAKLIADIGTEIAEEAHAAGLSPDQMSDWTLNRSEADIRTMPSRAWHLPRDPPRKAQQPTAPAARQRSHRHGVPLRRDGLLRLRRW